MKQLSVIIIGAGGRGRTYSHFMNEMPDKYKIVGVAEPNDVKRKMTQENFSIPEENCYESWEDILARPKFADVAIIATMDNMHYAPAMKAIELGYNLLLEKPVAPTAEECADIANAAEKAGVSAIVCHVLRYTPFYKKVKSIVDSGMIGEIMSIDHTEAIGDVHYSHSFVRGNWHCEAETTPLLLAKSCHDLDIIQWLIGKKCKKVTSFGSLSYFKADNAPEGAPVRCVDGTCPIKDSCRYNCRNVYLDPENHNIPIVWKQIYRNIVSQGHRYNDEELEEALRTTDYGLCVFHANNDMLDHQVVSMEFEDKVTATLTVNAFNDGGRYTRIYGTKGELYAFMSDKDIVVHTFADKKKHIIPVETTEESIAGGHGGGDSGIVYDLYDYFNGTYNGCSVADIRTSVSNHLIGFAAEEARHSDTVVSVDKFNEKYDFKA